MDAKHVPGPWIAYNTVNGRILSHWRIKSGCVRDEPAFAVINSDGKILPEYEAGTAALIAAAPDLLAACEAMEQLLAAAQENDPTWGLDTRVDGVRDMARAALAKARG